MAKSTKKAEVTYVLLKNIVPDPLQPRKFFDAQQIAELMKSIEAHGLMTPLSVEHMKDGTYMLVDGERRFRSLTELKYDSVPVIVMDAMSPQERLIKQFHIQEQHKGWTPTEKAHAMKDLAEAMGIPLPDMGRMLGIPHRTLSHYISFAGLLEKKDFMKNEIPISMADGISASKAAARHASKKLDEKFEVEDERQLEKVIIQKIKDKEISNTEGMLHIVHSFRRNPKVVRKFMKGDLSIESMYKNTDAKSYSIVSRVGIEAGFIASQAPRILESKDMIKLIKEDNRYANKIKRAAGLLADLIKAIA